jgi:hypothetical protein
VLKSRLKKMALDDPDNEVDERGRGFEDDEIISHSEAGSSASQARRKK